MAADPVRVSPAVLAGLPDRLRDAQRVFGRTGGLHAAGLFTPDGTLRVLREDVGRHNAVDKVAGWALRGDLLPIAGHVLLVSGRALFELAQKAVMIGVPVLAAVSAPSSLAASLAEETGLTLVGFLRGATMNVYAGAQRVAERYFECGAGWYVGAVGGNLTGHLAAIASTSRSAVSLIHRAWLNRSRSPNRRCRLVHLIAFATS